MKHQQVSVDYWAMLKAMLTYGGLTILGWMMFRLFNVVFTLPRKLRSQHQNIQETLQEFQRRYPDLNITEDDLKNAEKELEEWMQETKTEEESTDKAEKEEKPETTSAIEDKKSI